MSVPDRPSVLNSTTYQAVSSTHDDSLNSKLHFTVYIWTYICIQRAKYIILLPVMSCLNVRSRCVNVSNTFVHWIALVHLFSNPAIDSDCNKAIIVVHLFPTRRVPFGITSLLSFHTG